MSQEDKERHKEASASRLDSLKTLIGMTEIEEKQIENGEQKSSNERNPHNISALEYFDPNYNLDNKDIGKPREITTKIQRFRANLWLSEDYPLSLPEQVLPIVDLMAISSSHFAKLRDFITLQIPSGFPVKIGMNSIY